MVFVMHGTPRALECHSVRVGAPLRPDASHFTQICHARTLSLPLQSAKCHGCEGPASTVVGGQVTTPLLGAGIALLAASAIGSPHV